jgi:uncharacterized protein (DUF488 family)
MEEAAKIAELRFFTVGHSAHSLEHFLRLLDAHGVTVVVDTRSRPYSKYAPQFDREALKRAVLAHGLRYLWMGDVLGGRPSDPGCYDGEGHVLYGRVAESAEFQAGIRRLEQGATSFYVALLCSEEDPAHCHRRLLVTRVLRERGAVVQHIRGEGALETEEAVAARSGKALVEGQRALFTELEAESWRSTGAIGKPAAASIFE